MNSLLIASFGAAAGRAIAAEPRAHAIEFKQQAIFRSPENPGFAAWVQLWREAKPDELSVKFLTRRKPTENERVERPPVDLHRCDAFGLPARYDFSALVKPIEFSIVARDAAGYEPFGGGTPWVHGAKQIATTDAQGVARVSYPEQQAITDIHRSFQIAARFDPERTDEQFQRSTSLTIEYYAVTPTAK